MTVSKGLEHGFLLKRSSSCTLPAAAQHIENQHAIKNRWMEVSTRGQNFHETYWNWTKLHSLFMRNEQWLRWTTIKRKEWENSKQWCSARSVFILFSWSTLLFHAAVVHHLWCKSWPRSGVVGTHCSLEPPHTIVMCYKSANTCWLWCWETKCFSNSLCKAKCIWLGRKRKEKEWWSGIPPPLE